MIPKILFGLVSFLFTGFVFVNSYEIMANKDVLLGFSIRKMQSQDVINGVVREFEFKEDSRNLNANAKLGKLDYLEIPALNIQLQLEESRKVDNLWYQRLNLGHYIGLNEDDYGNPVDYLIYTNKSWRTIPYVEEIEEGMNISIFTSKGYEAEFIVDRRLVLSYEDAFVVSKSDKRQILLLVEDESNQVYYGYSLISDR